VNANSSGGVGVFVATNGALTYKGGEIQNNNGDGISLYNELDGIVKTVILSDLYIYNNDGYGVDIINKGAITLTNVRSNASGSSGAYLSNTACGTTTPCGVSLLTTGMGVNEFNVQDSGAGLIVYTYGAITLNKVSAIGNPGYGANIHNETATIPANITITGGTFNTNGNIGLYVRSKGVITVNSVEVSGTLNDSRNAQLDNTWDTTGTKGISVIKSKFNDGDATGLYLRSYGAVVLNTVEASDNAVSGADISNNYGLGKPVTLLAAYGANIFNNNGSDNIVIVSNGSVALTNVTGNSSISNDGIDIDNDSGTGTITMTNVTANYNSHNGFNLWTKGNVTITGITAMFNTNTGNYAGLYINTNEITTAKVTITTGLISSNTDHGILLNIAPNKLYTLSGVFYFGNDTDNDGIGYNLSVY
jgi:hypothetical protein